MYIRQDEIMAELTQIQEDELNERLAGADHVPVHRPLETETRPAAVEDDEDAQLKELQAALAM